MYNKILKLSIRKAKEIFYKTKFEYCKNDSKKTWQAINEVLHKTNKKEFPDHMNINNVKTFDKKQIANKFNDYFNTIGTNMAGTIENITNDNIIFSDYLKSNIDTSFEFQLVNEEDVKRTILNLNSKPSSGYNNISTILLKKLEPLITSSLTLIINQSLKTGIFPSKLKLAKIIPIYKKDDCHLISNYRPISLLPSLSKIFEKIVYDQLFFYFSNNKYLSKNQYGFRKLHSTEHAILEIVDRITLELDQGHTLLAIFLDLSKAFDTLDPEILLQKLSYYGVNGPAIKWFKTYLYDRPHFVEFDHCESDTKILSLGVPQGSILGPLLFTIYINDIQFCSDFFHFIKYADDTTLLSPNVSYNNHISTVINDEINKVYKWLCANKLSLNIQKTKYIIFHNQGKNINTNIPVIKIKDIFIDRVQNFNFLGVNLNENLNWNSHIDQISIKISRCLGIMYKLKNVLPIHILKILYYSLILPYLSYGILAWGASSARLRLFSLQKKAIRLITNSRFNAHTEPLFKALNLLKLEDIHKLCVLKFYFKYTHNELPAYLQSFFFLLDLKFISMTQGRKTNSIP